ncbi:MAG: hypothetical protein RLZ98_2601 [Pseudomonadota bacterium]
MLRIHGRANSINVRKVLWLAAELGLAFEREDWGRGYRPTTEAPFAALSPFGIVPVVEDDGIVLRESHTILRYLASKHGAHALYPVEITARARVEAWMDWASSELGNAMRPVFLGGIVKSQRYDFPEMIREAEADWNRMMTVLDGELSTGGPFLMGDGFTLADIAVGVYVHRWESLAFPKPDLAAISNYYSLLGRRAGFRTYLLTGAP